MIEQLSPVLVVESKTEFFKTHDHTFCGKAECSFKPFLSGRLKRNSKELTATWNLPFTSCSSLGCKISGIIFEDDVALPLTVKTFRVYVGSLIFCEFGNDQLDKLSQVFIPCSIINKSVWRVEIEFFDDCGQICQSITSKDLPKLIGMEIICMPHVFNQLYQSLHMVKIPYRDKIYLSERGRLQPVG